ncbi:hypothetical protein BGW42_003073 [Actinomortierella wolfii]|nr:hypothetical protein BGW42_003073 [Actinomortierella wolfii]
MVKSPHPFNSARQPNKFYFLRTQPNRYNPVDYFHTFRNIKASDKGRLHALWSSAIDILLESPLQIYKDNGKRLQLKWDTPDKGLGSFWHEIESAESISNILDASSKSIRKRSIRSAEKSILSAIDELDDTSTSSSTDLTFNTDDLSDGITDEDDVPVAISRLVGPGTRSSKLSRKSLYYKGNVCISERLMSYRRKQVEDESFLQGHQVNNILALNFIFHDDYLQDLRAAEKSRWEYTLKQADLKLVMDIAMTCSTQERAEALKQLYRIAHECNAFMSPIILTAQNLMATNALWANKPLVRDNEDSFTERFCKPFVNAFFGQFENTRLCWNRDLLKTDDQDTGERLFPDIMLCTTTSPGHTIVIGEIKKLDAGEQGCQRDRVKLFVQMKRALDSLLDYGVDGPVIGILVQRHRVEIWAMTLPFEALYMPTHLGSFDLILSRYYFGALVALTPPLFAAKAAVEHTLALIKDGPHPLLSKKSWRRGTYHFEPVVLNEDLSVKKEAKTLRQKGAMKPSIAHEEDIQSREDEECKVN